MSRKEDLEFEDQKLRRYVKASLILHVAIFLALTIKATFFNEAPIDFENAIRVDMVGLPDKITQDLPPAPEPQAAEKKEPPKPEPPKPEPVKPEPPKPKLVEKPKPVDQEAVNLNKTKNKQKQALEKLKQMEALEAIQKDLENENKKKAAQAASQVKYKGNVLSSGSELTGVSKLQAETYISDVHRHMLNNWSLPQYMRKRSYRTDVLVRFDEGGNILSKSVVKSSGNPAYDEFVLSAIQKSSPVPPPPAKFAKIASVEGFLFKFSDED